MAVDGPDLKMHQTYEYDAAGRVKRHRRDQSGAIVTTETSYDPLGRVTSTTTDNFEIDGALKSVSTTTSYDLGQRRIVRTLPGAATVTEIIDGLGRTQSRTTAAPKEIVEEFAYDIAGNQVFAGEKCTSCGTAQWIGSATAHDAHGRAVATLNADGTKVMSSGHDGWGNPQSVETRDATGALVSKSALDFTPTGTLKSSVSDLGGKTRQSDYRWDGAGRSTVSAVSGRASLSRFDPLGRIVSSSTGEGSASGVSNAFSSYSVAAGGYSGTLPAVASMKEKNADPIAATYDYDTAGNVTKQKVGALEWQRKFDEAGNLTSSASPSRPPTQYSYDGRGALTKEHRADSSDLKHTHDANGAARSYADPLETTSTETDLLGRPLKRTYPDGTTEVFSYEGSRVQTYKDRQSRSYVYEYDQAGRLHRIMLAGGELIELRDYDGAGRVAGLTTADAAVTFGNYDLDGHPHLTRQIRYKNHSGFTAKDVLDDYSQTHDYNEHGERIAFTVPYSGTAPGWTTSVQLAYDAAGNVTQLQRTLSGSAAPQTLLSADYRSAGRPIRRDLSTDCAGAANCTPAQILRQYAYDDAGGGQLKQMKVISRNRLVGGSDITYDGLQIRSVKLLGISGDRVNEYTYDERSRLKTASFGKPSGGAPSEEKVTSYDFREALERPKTTPVDPPSMTFEHAPGHKIASVTRDGVTRKFSYGTGAERIDDGRFTYVWDARGRMVRATEKPQPGATALRRVSYEYTATDRIVGRTAEYAALVPPNTTPASSDWRFEDRPEVLAADSLPAQITFIWDPISDQLLSIAIAGASSATDANAGILRQILHGGLGYDDPIEVTAVGEGITTASNASSAGPSTAGSQSAKPASTIAPSTVGSQSVKPASTPTLTRLYPVYDAAAGSLQLTLNGAGEVISRSLMQGAYGEDTVALNGVAIDRIAIRAKKDSSGKLESVEVTMRATEALDPATVAMGARLATVTADGTVARLTPVPPSLLSDDTIHWLLTAAEWETLTNSAPSVVAGATLTPASLSVAATSTLRSAAWSSSASILRAPGWAIASQPVYSVAGLPVEGRQSLTVVLSFITSASGGLSSESTIYKVEALAELCSTGSSQQVGRASPSSFHALPFTEQMTSQVFVRARWYDVSTGAVLSPDPLGYRDSANLYAFADPVNQRDPSGLAGYFFDGTWNDKDVMVNKTNVAKLYLAYKGRAKYLRGVGTSLEIVGNKQVGGAFGVGGTARLEEMYTRLTAWYNAGDRQIDIFGFSRGGALAVAFANMIEKRGIPDLSSARQVTERDAEGTTWQRTVYDHYFSAPKINFVGVFDVVGSFGIPGNKENLGFDLSRPKNTGQIRHATASEEERFFFPMTSMLDAPGRGPANVKEVGFRGVHSDIGGGYEDLDTLAHGPLNWMWREAVASGVPLNPLSQADQRIDSSAAAHYSSSAWEEYLNIQYQQFGWKYVRKVYYQGK